MSLELTTNEQCAIPAFDGLLPEPHNSIVMTLLFRLTEWHALAKLRLHTDSTLTRLDLVTTLLGQDLRQFSRVTCASFSTMELPKEAAARGRHQALQSAKALVPLSDPTNDELLASSTSTLPTPKPVAKAGTRKHFNLWTYKFHSLGDYVRTIHRYGTTDSYSSQTVRHVSLVFSHAVLI